MEKEIKNCDLDFNGARAALNAIFACNKVIEPKFITYGVNIIKFEKVEVNETLQYYIETRSPFNNSIENFTVSFDDIKKTITINNNFEFETSKTDRRIDMVVINTDENHKTSLLTIIENNHPTGYITLPYDCKIIDMFGQVTKVEITDLITMPTDQNTIAPKKLVKD